MFWELNQLQTCYFTAERVVTWMRVAQNYVVLCSVPKQTKEAKKLFVDAVCNFFLFWVFCLYSFLLRVSRLL